MNYADSLQDLGADACRCPVTQGVTRRIVAGSTAVSCPCHARLPRTKLILIFYYINTNSNIKTQVTRILWIT